MSTLAVSTFACACMPYPIYKTLQPGAKATVRDVQGRPLSGAAVTLLARAYPYGREKSRATQLTQADGIANFPPRREWRTEVLAMHGSEEFFWNWCVRKEGFETVSTTNRTASEFVIDAVVILKEGRSAACPEGTGQ